MIFSKQLKAMDANRYATKKTIAQGMLDIALLTANASQLKYILQVGDRHEFYTLMLTLICISIVMQVSVIWWQFGPVINFARTNHLEICLVNLLFGKYHRNVLEWIGLFHWYS